MINQLTNSKLIVVTGNGMVLQVADMEQAQKRIDDHLTAFPHSQCNIYTLTEVHSNKVERFVKEIA